MSEERCETCKFWKLETNHTPSEPAPNPGNLQGKCRRNPPQLNGVFFVARGIDVDEAGNCVVDPNEATFPSSWGSDWCGEYRPRPVKGERIDALDLSAANRLIEKAVRAIHAESLRKEAPTE